jgi:hypothetical protein
MGTRREQRGAGNDNVTLLECRMRRKAYPAHGWPNETAGALSINRLRKHHLADRGGDV